MEFEIKPFKTVKCSSSSCTNLCFLHNTVPTITSLFVHTSLALSCLRFLLFLRFGFQSTVCTQPLSDLQKLCSCSILHLINGVTCTDSLHLISNRIEDTVHCETCFVIIGIKSIGYFKNEVSSRALPSYKHTINPSCDKLCNIM